jgi:peptidoglycan/xylan/chitin deacetylase (PgdA/CDA1 family)
VTRFHITLIATILLAGLGIAMGSPMFAVVVGVLSFIVFGCGVAIPQLKFFGDFICSGDGVGKKVALTFDDGPDARSTPQLLDLLREEKVAASFFCIGKRVEAEPVIAKRILTEGHLIENHSYAHSNATNFFPLQKLTDDLQDAQCAIQTATGRSPKLFRPPIGLSNPNVFRAARKFGLRVVGWNIRTFDTQISEPGRIVQRVERSLKPGSIILLHDGNIPAERLLMTVGMLISKLREHGYEIVRLDKLIG